MNEKLSPLLFRLESEDPPSRGDIEVLYSRVVDNALTAITRAREMEECSLYETLQNALDEMRGDLRESVQALTRPDIWDVIVKLRGNSEISAEDIELIRLWIVGDADAYVEEENSFPDWIQELDRLTAEIRKLRDGPIEVDRLNELRALVKDARGVAWSIGRFLADRERVQHFEKGIAGGIDAEARSMLADILVRSYESRKV